METSIVSTALVLLFVIDPFGNVPILLSVLRPVPPERRYKVVIRELAFGLLIMLSFLYLGERFLDLLHLQTEAVTIAGGIILFVIGIRLIFPSPQRHALYGDSEEPFFVPIAIPMIAGPSALATILVTSHSVDQSMLDLSLALLLAWGISALVLLSSPFMYRLLKDKGLQAMERLMGMLLLIMSVQMFINGISSVIRAFP